MAIAIPLILAAGAGTAIYYAAKDDGIKQGAFNKPQGPRVPVNLDAWGPATDAELEVRTDAMVSADPDDLDGTSGGSRPPPPLHATTFALVLDTPTVSSTYRVHVIVVDRNALQARTRIAWRTGTGHAIDPHNPFTGYYVAPTAWEIQPERAATCYAERLQRAIEVSQGVVGAGEYTARGPLPCPGKATPAQDYTIGKGTAYYLAKQTPYPVSDRIPYGAEYVRQQSLRLDVVDGKVALLGKVAPSIAGLILDVRARWWKVAT